MREPLGEPQLPALVPPPSALRYQSWCSLPKSDSEPSSKTTDWLATSSNSLSRRSKESSSISSPRTSQRRPKRRQKLQLPTKRGSEAWDRAEASATRLETMGGLTRGVSSAETEPPTKWFPEFKREPHCLTSLIAPKESLPDTVVISLKME